MTGIVYPAIGGALIGSASFVLMMLLGRIAGISGIFASLLPPGPDRDWPWRAAFLTGLLGGPLLVGALTGDDGIGAPVVALPVMIGAGVLVGIGTVLGGGCTSGHGVCGISRLSPRSFAATGVFVACAAVVVFVMRHVL